MKKLWILSLLASIGLFSCKNSKNDESQHNSVVTVNDMAYNAYGEDIVAYNHLNPGEMEEKYNSLSPGDTIAVSFNTTVESVCKNKGCWMTLHLPSEQETVMVKFKDYGFFVPKDIENKDVIVQGKAFIEEVSIEDQRHFAEDKGQSEEEIATITSPKRTYSFLADGVLIKE